MAVLDVELADGTRLVAKYGDGHLSCERRMLEDLSRLSSLPLPEVLHGDDDLLLLEHIPHDNAPLTAPAERDAARLISDLHAVRGPAFGYPVDTVIGRLPQPNAWTQRWIEFFRDHRLVPIARAAHDEGALPTKTWGRLVKLADRLDVYLEEPPHPSLLHGDLWRGNVLARGDRIVAFIDPALFFGHPEFDLATADAYGTLGASFYDRYAEHASLDAQGFFGRRRDVYALYPLIVNVRVWSATYLEPIDAALDRLGL